MAEPEQELTDEEFQAASQALVRKVTESLNGERSAVAGNALAIVLAITCANDEDCAAAFTTATTVFVESFNVALDQLDEPGDGAPPAADAS